jgi:apolipoprotein N-acyltransferase
VWPEAAIPTRPEDVPFYLKLLTKVAKLHNTTILTGIPFYDTETKRDYNGILALGVNEGRYYKRHLVPFGEYLPLRFILSWLHSYLTIPMSGFFSGAKNQPDLLVDKTIIAPFICYEIAYADLVLGYFPKAGLIVRVCDDAWFGKSIAAAHHLEVALMRSLEVGRYQLLSTNMGITAFIDADGRVISQAPEFERTVLTQEIQALSGSTPWVRFGRYVWVLLLVVGLFVSWIKRR